MHPKKAPHIENETDAHTFKSHAGIKQKQLYRLLSS